MIEKWLDLRFEMIFPQAAAGIREAIATILIPQAELIRPQRLAFCLAQYAHETGGFRWLEERGKVSYFSRYDFNRGLGNTRRGDGLRFKGRGLPMLTGRWNYAALANDQGWTLEETVERLGEAEGAATAGAWFWKVKHCNALADAGDFVGLTQKINGGLNGLVDRQAWLTALYASGLGE